MKEHPLNKYPLNFLIKGTTKLYSRHYSCGEVIILFSTGLWKSAFSPDSFKKLFLQVFDVFCLLNVQFDVCLINLSTIHDHCVHSNFVLTYLKQFFKTETRHKTLSIALKVIKSVYIALSRQRHNATLDKLFLQIFLTRFVIKVLIDFINSIHLIKERFKKDVTAKIAIFGPPSPHVTIDTISGHPLPSSHRVNIDKL